jgi:beta-fructofuranosidase
MRLLVLTSLALGTASIFKKHDKGELHYEAQPKYHVRPQQGWLNDPNGPVFHNGKYHLFFQHNEEDATWGNIVWGHATSADLVHWELVSPILTKPPRYERGGAWSGSMYKRGHDVVALYTCTDGKFRNAQCEAIADDSALSSFTRNADNPIIKTPPENIPQGAFRDPTEPFHWIGRDYTFIGATDARGPRGVVLTYDLDGYVFRGHFYEAPPLQQCLGWRDGPRCASVMLECPDVFDAATTLSATTILKLSLGAALRKDVVLIGAVEGNADGRGPAFRAKEHRTQHRCDGPELLPGAIVLDCGSAYASKSFTDQQGRRVSWSWLPDYGGPATPPVLRYNGTLTLPRVLTVEKGELRSRFLPELKELRMAKESHHLGDGSETKLHHMADQAELRLWIPQSPKAVTVSFKRYGHELRANVACARMVCRVSIVTIADGEEFTPCEALTFGWPGLTVPLIVYLDGSSVEWDLGDGRSSCAHRWYGVTPTEHDGDLAVTVRFVDQVRLEAWRLKSACEPAEHKWNAAF